MHKLLALAVLFFVSACGVVPPVSSVPVAPVSVADRTILDEKTLTAVELAYRAARTLAELGVDTGRLKGASAAKAQVLNRKAYAALGVMRSAYRTGNAASWGQAYGEAQGAIAGILALTGGSN